MTRQGTGRWVSVEVEVSEIFFLQFSLFLVQTKMLS